MEPLIHEETIRVRYEETDRMGVVYHSNYLVYFEVGRTEFMRARGGAYRDLEERGVQLAVTESVCKHKGSLRYDDVAVVETWVSDLRKSRVTFSYRVSRVDGEARVPVAEGSTTLACLTAQGKPRRLPDEVRVQMEEALMPGRGG